MQAIQQSAQWGRFVNMAAPTRPCPPRPPTVARESRSRGDDRRWDWGKQGPRVCREGDVQPPDARPCLPVKLHSEVVCKGCGFQHSFRCRQLDHVRTSLGTDCIASKLCDRGALLRPIFSAEPRRVSTLLPASRSFGPAALGRVQLWRQPPDPTATCAQHVALRLALQHPSHN